MRTNIEIDDVLINRARQLTGLRTKREIVNAALRMLVRLREQSAVRELRGKLDWEGDLNQLRQGRDHAGGNTTVWVDYFIGIVNPETDYLDRAISEELILVGDLILAETLQGFREDKDFNLAHSALSKFEQAEMLNLKLAHQSAQNYRTLRNKGVTVRKTIECLIATFCISESHFLLHRDSDFDGFEKYLGLKVVHPDRTVR